MRLFAESRHSRKVLVSLDFVLHSRLIQSDVSLLTKGLQFEINTHYVRFKIGVIKLFKFHYHNGFILR